MGSGHWFKTIINLKRVKDEKSQNGKRSSVLGKSTGSKWKHHSWKETTRGNHGVLDMPVEDVAAIRIQTAFRAFMARRTLRRLKGTVRLQILIEGHSTKKQASSTLSYLHSWSRIQAQIRDRRLCMVTEGRIRQKKLDSQLKLEAKLHDLEVEWCGGSETMEELLARINQREEAAVKRERAMAYAFSHQWRANSSLNQILGPYELGKAYWGWSWMDHWIAARPWESRVATQFICPKQGQNKQGNKVGKNSISPTTEESASAKPTISNGKGIAEARRRSYPPAEKPSAHGNGGVKETYDEKEQAAS